jgi:signal peptidase I
MLGFVGAFVLSIMAAVAVALVLRRVVLQVSVVASDSMYPTLRMGDRILVWKVHRCDVRRNDVVVFREASSGVDDMSRRPRSSDDMKPRDSVELVKRVAACPGDRVVWSADHVSAHNIGVGVASAPPVTGWLRYELTLGTDELFLVGDDVARSEDSRHFGPVHTSAVVGRVIARLWPVRRFARF